MKRFLLVFFIGLMQCSIKAQETTDSIQKIDEIIIQSQRIQLPFSKNSHSINILKSSDLPVVAASSLDEILQTVTGVDIRRRGIDGIQSDLYIRGGNFNQTLLLIDGIKMDDAQTGHHTMNAIIPLDNIERVEVIKGASARIYGQNAMNGAVNIVTKKVNTNKAILRFTNASYNTYGIGLALNQKLKEGSMQVYIDRLQSDGYRYNTDFLNHNVFFKSQWKDYTLLFTYGQRNFGANGFYASPEYTEQYEETNTHLLSIQKKISNTHWKHTVSTYWRRNKDMYLFLRRNPSYYKNVHINNKLGLSYNTSTNNSLGKTGLGIDINQVNLESNNLGNHNRFSITSFVEHRFEIKDVLDITPGLAYTYYSDITNYLYPGIDIGYRFSDVLKFYSNIGYTSRIPTYTNLYYNSPIESGNPDLKPEKALTYDIGFHYDKNDFYTNVTYFNRKITDLIDWTKQDESSVWQAMNINEATTNGFEISITQKFAMLHHNQILNVNFTALDDKIKNDVAFSRYSLNSYKYKFDTQLTSAIIKNIKQYISYSYIERENDENYHLLDASVLLNYKRYSFKLQLNNILNTVYTETNLVPMPGTNYTINFKMEI